MVLDSSGFVRRSRVFAGNASEPATLQDMLGGLGAPKGAAVVMDAAGIATAATQANLAWLKTNDYHYVVVSRKRDRQFDPMLATEVQTAGDVTLKIHRVDDAKTGEARLYCHSLDQACLARQCGQTLGNPSWRLLPAHHAGR